MIAGDTEVNFSLISFLVKKLEKNLANHAGRLNQNPLRFSQFRPNLRARARGVWQTME
jgi:hypothetical protein